MNEIKSKKYERLKYKLIWIVKLFCENLTNYINICTYDQVTLKESVPIRLQTSAAMGLFTT